MELRCARRRSCDWAALACVPGKPTLAVWGGGSVVPLSSGLHGPSECPRDVTSPEQVASRSERAGASRDIPVMQPKVTHRLPCTASPAQRGGRVSQDTRARRPGWLGAVWEAGHHGGLWRESDARTRHQNCRLQKIGAFALPALKPLTSHARDQNRPL